MLGKLVCLLWGHKYREKQFDGSTYDTVDHLTRLPVKGKFYTWKWLDVCPRCGKKLKETV